ncbi:hypothetical protein GUITHDRAFT_91990 [Guillardia theta CCMP2712]|uniref:EamA domain-containing protein n=1 Tax=Guillardia theta (strain CCMP2712) TaxID=905079 RepID=L1JXK5_GUITC|nr:hypothetical protein GUITHDRAFT_91990 [Guillardia theta CCMP2712]EKX53281.1 hypothetical protein GUITHDRAFT_91990 [Guillardia theta CCMP2712]|eukprot:XP_005840261.1 hypothetical protein GUITHDRAFT_91990 [Guillardia theta CCMP2712]
MLVSGSINTICTKYADMQCTFDHPFVQAAGMFLGEMFCLFALQAVLCFGIPVERNRDYPVMLFALPALCDLVGTSLMYLGLTMTYASVFQMLRGSVVLFTGILSVIVLGKRLAACHWTGMMLVLAGAFVVGSASLKTSDTTLAPSNPVLGNLLIVSAQFVVGIQMVVEEKFLSKYQVHALEAVGLEGVFGLLYLSVGLVAMYYIPLGNDVCQGRPCVENAISAGLEIASSPVLALVLLGNIVSIAFFNFFGISVTKSLSATHRMVLDSLRTIVIWGFSIFARWQSFDQRQVIGFCILFAGSMIYNEVIRLPFAKEEPWPEAEVNIRENAVKYIYEDSDAEENEALLNEHDRP